MRAIVLTSTLRRHQFVANTLASRLDVTGVWQEEKSFEPLRYARSADDGAVIERHFAARDASEAEYCADHDRVRVRSFRLPPGGCNESGTIDTMRRDVPDVVLVFGTGLLKQALIDTFPGRILNIHLGLSPFYRGAGTNFWPLVNREPEYCGATIHFLDAGVDTGPVIVHVRPDIRRKDGPHDIGNRTIVAAAAALADAAVALGAGGVRGVQQTGGGRLYKRADFSADAVSRLYANFADGMIDEYLQHRAARDAAVPLVQLEAAPPTERAAP
jgi:folate-dependent phosphoribosylglycinamide formyltransferase PurN